MFHFDCILLALVVGVVVVVVVIVVIDHSLPKQDDDPPVLEYQVGGRLNHTTFVLQLSEAGSEAVGAIAISRQASHHSEHSALGFVHLELTHLFQQSFFAPRGG